MAYVDQGYHEYISKKLYPCVIFSNLTSFLPPVTSNIIFGQYADVQAGQGYHMSIHAKSWSLGPIFQI